MYMGIRIQTWGQHAWHRAEKHYYEKLMQIWDWGEHLNIQRSSDGEKKWKQTMNSVHSSSIMQKTVGYSLCHDFINTIKWLTISKCKKTEAIIMKEQVWLKAQKSYHSKND
jgi:hypothetical protein